MKTHIYTLLLLIAMIAAATTQSANPPANHAPEIKAERESPG